MLSEFKKIINIKTAVIYVGIFVVFMLIFWFTLRGVQKADNTSVRKELYDEFEGKITQESAQRLSLLWEHVNEILSQEMQMESDYNSGKISADDYMSYRNEYHSCNKIHIIVDEMWERCQTEIDNSGYLVYDDYYNKLFSRTSVYVCFGIFTVLTSVLLLSCEPRELCAVIGSTKSGRQRLFVDKHRFLSVYIMTITLIYMVVRYVIAASYYGFEQVGAPVQSIEVLSRFPFRLSIGAYMAFDIIVKPLIAVLAGNLILAAGKFSGTFRKYR